MAMKYQVLSYEICVGRGRGTESRLWVTLVVNWGNLW